MPSFLSCLCGSERIPYIDEDCPGFLSCLCGSELLPLFQWPSWCFLSCLCGSELKLVAGQVVPRFLSCLCGSEQAGAMHKPLIDTEMIVFVRPDPPHGITFKYLNS